MGFYPRWSDLVCYSIHLGHNYGSFLSWHEQCSRSTSSHRRWHFQRWVLPYSLTFRESCQCAFLSGLAAPLVAQRLLGASGEYAMLFLILMAVMSTGSAEVIALASIIIYDIYQAYIKPFRTDLKRGQCIICGRYMHKAPAKQSRQQADNELCSCPSAHSCLGCHEDTLARAKSKSLVKPHFTCPVHKDFKEYQVLITWPLSTFPIHRHLTINRNVSSTTRTGA